MSTHNIAVPEIRLWLFLANFTHPFLVRLGIKIFLLVPCIVNGCKNC